MCFHELPWTTADYTRALVALPLIIELWLFFAGSLVDDVVPASLAGRGGGPGLRGARAGGEIMRTSSCMIGSPNGVSASSSLFVIVVLLCGVLLPMMMSDDDA